MRAMVIFGLSLSLILLVRYVRGCISVPVCISTRLSISLFLFLPRLCLYLRLYLPLSLLSFFPALFTNIAWLFPFCLSLSSSPPLPTATTASPYHTIPLHSKTSTHTNSIGDRQTHDAWADVAPSCNTDNCSCEGDYIAHHLQDNWNPPEESRKTCQEITGETMVRLLDTWSCFCSDNVIHGRVFIRQLVYLFDCNHCCIWFYSVCIIITVCVLCFRICTYGTSLFDWHIYFL